jgi:hypothetical protein
MQCVYSRKDMAFADRLDAALKARGFEPLAHLQTARVLQGAMVKLDCRTSR